MAAKSLEDPPIYHSEGVFYRTLLSEVPELAYVTKEREWLIESLCKAVVRLQLEGRLEKQSVTISFLEVFTDTPTFVIEPNIGWDYDESAAHDFVSMESWGDEITLTEVLDEMPDDTDHAKEAMTTEKEAMTTESEMEPLLDSSAEESSEEKSPESEVKKTGQIHIHLHKPHASVGHPQYIKESQLKQRLHEKSLQKMLTHDDLPEVLLHVYIIESVSICEEPSESNWQRLRMYKKPKVRRFIDDLCSRRDWKPGLDEGDYEELVNILAGETTQSIRELLSLSMAHAGKFDIEFIKWSHETNSHIFNTEEGSFSSLFGSNEVGEISVKKSTTRFKDIAGIDEYVRWVSRTGKRFSGEAAEFGFTSFPRGALLLGPPGTGKTTMAKATANSWDFGILRVKSSDLFIPGWGEGEQMAKDIFNKATENAPCILFLDEIEKLFDTKVGKGGSDLLGGVKAMFLEFMQENPSPVFVIATTNSLGSLPPEVVERFDGRWFVNLPDAEAREMILKIHLGLRKQKLGRKVLQEIASNTEGFSGRGLEDLIDEAMSLAFDSGAPNVQKEHLDAAQRGSKPVSFTHKEEITKVQKLVEQGLVRDASGKVAVVEGDALEISDVSFG